jgi:hypothetical protein
MLRAQNATQPLVHAPRDVARGAVPARGRTRNGLAPRMAAVAAITCLVAWGCIGAVLYFQDAPTPYVLDREDD